MKAAATALLGYASGIAGVVSLFYLSMATRELFDALHGHLSAGIPRWDPYVSVGTMGRLSFTAFYMPFRFLHTMLFC